MTQRSCTSVCRSLISSFLLWCCMVPSLSRVQRWKHMCTHHLAFTPLLCVNVAPSTCLELLGLGSYL
uniref:Uncharacterized protein n=1 Tax=Arundo donax TaxID=35708 RepID=A0A0A8ZZZ2_ARUDO